MLTDIIKQFNWIDILVIIILFRISYISVKTGVPVEFFKLLGMLATIYLSLHYYTTLADWVVQRTPLAKEKAPLEFLDFVSFLFLAIVGYFIFISLRIVFSRFIRMEAAPNLNRFAGLALGIARGFLLAGLIIFMLVISSSSYLRNSVINSYLGKRMFKVAPNTYSWLWNKVASKFASGEKLNQTLLEVQKGLNL